MLYSVCCGYELLNHWKLKCCELSRCPLYQEPYCARAASRFGYTGLACRALQSLWKIDAPSCLRMMNGSSIKHCTYNFCRPMWLSAVWRCMMQARHCVVYIPSLNLNICPDCTSIFLVRVSYIDRVKTAYITIQCRTWTTNSLSIFDCGEGLTRGHVSHWPFLSMLCLFQ